jgi:hypothetical protein
MNFSLLQSVQFFSSLEVCQDPSFSVSRAFLNVDGFTSPSLSSGVNRSHEREGFVTQSGELSVHTGHESHQVR